MPTAVEPTTSPEETGRLLVAPEPLLPLRVAFIGQAGTGKTTHAQLLRAKYKGDALSFASPLKKITAELFDERMADPQFARTANQEVGILARRLAGPDIWVIKLLAKVSSSRNCFIDDCRFMSEYHALKRLGFIIIKLAATQQTLQERRPTMTKEQWQHESERDSTFISPDLTFSTDALDEQGTHRAMVAALELIRNPITF